MADATNRRVTVVSEEDTKKPKKRATTAKKKKEAAAEPTAVAVEPKAGDPCPLCGQGHVISGKTALGCSRWKEGCTWRLPFKQ